MTEDFISKDVPEYISSSELAKAAETSKEEWSKKLSMYYLSAYGQQVKKYIENPVQEAVICGVRRSAEDLRIECYSPLWGNVNICVIGEQRFQDFQRGDILSLIREKSKADNAYVYTVVENKTKEEIKQQGIEKILKRYLDSQRKVIMLVGEQERKQK